MNRLLLFAGFLVLLMMVVAIVVATLYQMQRQARLKSRLSAAMQLDGAAPPAGGEASYGVAAVVVAVGTKVAGSGLLSQKTVSALEQTLASTGVRGSSALGLFVGAKVVLLLVLPVLAFAVMQRLDVSPVIRNGGLAATALAGMLAPDLWIGRRYKKHLAAVMQGLPDALDLLVICAEAGLSFEPAITRVADEIRSAHPAISQEFRQTAGELRVTADSKAALYNMGTRTGLEGLKRMASMLVQTIQYGTPLSDALRVLSAEMRQEMLIRFETRAARLPVLLTIPMILFILPCIFLIVGGPAVIMALHTYSP
jgi:tight adherence protein C